MPHPRSVLTGLAVFCAGFGAMNVFALGLERSPNLRGLYSYWTSSAGDGVLLPFIAYALAEADRSLDSVQGDHGAAVWGGLGAALVGAGTQAAWLLDRNPGLNWTLPAPHTFNAAGWYHAAFTVGLAGLLGALSGRFLWRFVRGTQPVPARARSHGTIALAAAAVFAGLAVIDNLDSHTRVASRSTLVALAIGGSVLLGGICTIWRSQR